jgi:asparagine synthase (glutamine-hydrolysing)
MCGIYGYIDRYKKIDKAAAIKNLELINHRGPDGDGYWVSEDESVFFGHKRLSIIDIDAGSQPMFSKNNEFGIVFNGELYNYIEIRTKLIALGHHFSSNSDTEVFLTAFIEWGIDCVDLFNGMFAASIWQEIEGKVAEVWLFRDVFGEKPLYFFNNSSQFEFGSEIRQLKAPQFLDYKGIEEYLFFGFHPGRNTFLVDVESVGPGQVVELNLLTHSAKVVKQRFLPPLGCVREVVNIEDIWERLLASISIRLRSDVDVGALLSGGLDSSLIVAGIKNLGMDVPTYNVANPNAALDETNFAHQIAKRLGVKHHTIEVPQDFQSAAADLSQYIDIPYGDLSVIPSMLLYRSLGSRHKVILGGDGGDELFGGYRHYLTTLQLEDSRLLASGIRALRLSAMAKYLPRNLKGRNFLQSLRTGIEDQWINTTSYFNNDQINELMNPLFRTCGHLPDQLLPSLSQESSPIENSLRFDQTEGLSNRYLYKTDSCSMSASIELRSPYLDYDLFEYMNSIGMNKKMNKISTRIIQKLLVKKHIGDDINWDRKMGFSLGAKISQKLLDTEAIKDQIPSFLNKGYVLKIIQSDNPNDASRQFSLFSLISAINNFSKRKIGCN